MKLKLEPYKYRALDGSEEALFTCSSSENPYIVLQEQLEVDGINPEYFILIPEEQYTPEDCQQVIEQVLEFWNADNKTIDLLCNALFFMNKEECSSYMRHVIDTWQA